ncbi:MAG: hypothetical protein QOI80_1879 [Solirubrobacteraceae bacterium]|jgi:hypothetical protein|nr:hypothetical protein [Solirubrobacteraceae bacterium]
MGLFKRLFGKEEADWQSGVTPVPTQPAQPPPAVPGTDFNLPFVTGNIQKSVITGAEAQEALQGIERAMNMDLDGDGKIARGAPAPPGETPWAAWTQAMAPGAGPAPDVVSQLERLAALKASGALTEAEFAAEKAKLLGT